LLQVTLHVHYSQTHQNFTNLTLPKSRPDLSRRSLAQLDWSVAMAPSISEHSKLNCVPGYRSHLWLKHVLSILFCNLSVSRVILFFSELSGSRIKNIDWLIAVIVSHLNLTQFARKHASVAWLDSLAHLLPMLAVVKYSSQRVWAGDNAAGGAWERVAVDWQRVTCTRRVWSVGPTRYAPLTGGTMWRAGG